MRHEFLHKEDSKRLILIFAGWGTDPGFYRDVEVKGFDTLVVYDYRDLSFPADILDGYSTVIVFAWSLGVFAASLVLPPDKVTAAIAINGTECPVDDLKGIPESVFMGTMENLDERNLLKFRKRMSGIYFSEIRQLFPDSDITALKNELAAIASACASTVSVSSSDANSTPGNRVEERKRLRWTRAYISSGDSIFPPFNQLAFWQASESNPEIVELKEPHYIDLARMVRSVVPSKEKVATRFNRALASYDDTAEAQHAIALRLAEMLGEERRGPLNSIVEVGSGSGLLTRLIGERFSPDQATFVDLYPLPEYGIADEELYVEEDGEEWIERESKDYPGSYDAVVSASAMQWFVNPERFLTNAGRLLKPDGTLAVSTFLPGNLEELRAVNPYGLLYLSEARLSEMLHGMFGEVRIESTRISLTFPSPRELLRHLSLTGVGGSGSGARGNKEHLSSFPSSLTYTPVCIIASKFLNL